MDCETGEIVQHSAIIYCDVETGEPIMNDNEIIKPLRNRTRFTIPKSCLKQKNEAKKPDKCYLSSTQETFTLTSKKKVIELKEVIITKIFFSYDINISHFVKCFLFYCNLVLHLVGFTKTHEACKTKINANFYFFILLTNCFLF